LIYYDKLSNNINSGEIPAFNKITTLQNYE